MGRLPDTLLGDGSSDPGLFKDNAMHPLRRAYIEKGLITPDPYLSMTPLTADEMDVRGFHAAAHAKRRR